MASPGLLVLAESPIRSLKPRTPMPEFPAEKFLDFVSNFDPNLPNHKAAISEYAALAKKSAPELFTDESNWVRVFRASGRKISLKVPYFPQRDNFKDPLRTCFSSACAMLLEYLKPGTLPGPKGDDKYLQVLLRNGDTIHAEVQLKTLASFGVQAQFTKKLTFRQLDDQLKSQKPVPIGILHHGPANSPSGGGHWIIVTGVETDSKAPGGCWYIVNDPYGELDNSTGVYTSTKGSNLRYSKGMLSKRWTVEGDGSGWAVIV